ncbi:hypothetical protein R1sor_021328 [Riccia sorocarpa]|uniref:DUF4219 domain-containing protein n=1 Tax=Riccia sorocarpa TaxID=122646 RepID=A0ABD3GIL7_9MARC
MPRGDKKVVPKGVAKINIMVSNTGTTFSEREKLRGDENYSTWRWRVQGILDERDLWDVVETPASPAYLAWIQSYTPVPSASGSAATSSTVTQQVAVSQQQLTVFEAERKTRRKAMNVLRASLSEDVITHVFHLDDPHGCWDALRGMYNTKTNG